MMPGNCVKGNPRGLRLRRGQWLRRAGLLQRIEEQTDTEQKRTNSLPPRVFRS